MSGAKASSQDFEENQVSVYGTPNPSALLPLACCKVTAEFAQLSMDGSSTGRNIRMLGSTIGSNYRLGTLHGHVHVRFPHGSVRTSLEHVIIISTYI